MNKTATKKTQAERVVDKLERLPGTSGLEWLVAGISGACLAAVIAYLGFIALTAIDGAARIEVEVSGVRTYETGHVVEFVATNRAEESAAGVEIRGQLRDGTNIVEESSVTLDYLPRHSGRKGGLIFVNDPRRHDLRLFAAGYFEP